MPFPYFGRKKNAAHLYPRPTHDTIIEPFAGSAAYALHADHWQRNVILVENHPRIAALWRWLIHDATHADIHAALPDLQIGDRVTEDASPASYLQLLGMTNNQILRSYTVTEYAQLQTRRMRHDVATQLHKIRHWTIIEGDYTDAPDIAATWFVDPPYQDTLGYSQRNSLDYQSLARWCQIRQGQTIVCEHVTADWLPFAPLTAVHNINKTATKVEGVWLSEPDAGRLF